jgi:hypothetical protein
VPTNSHNGIKSHWFSSPTSAITSCRGFGQAMRSTSNLPVSAGNEASAPSISAQCQQ